MVINENCCNFIVLDHKRIQAIFTMIIEDKVIEIFCLADDFRKFFDTLFPHLVCGIGEVGGVSHGHLYQEGAAWQMYRNKPC